MSIKEEIGKDNYNFDKYVDVLLCEISKSNQMKKRQLLRPISNKPNIYEEIAFVLWKIYAKARILKEKVFGKRKATK